MKIKSMIRVVNDEIDDMVLNDVEYIHLERMDYNAIWLQLDNIRIYFRSKTAINIEDMED